MSDAAETQVGTIGWRDLTVDDAEGIRDFYAGVVGWKSESLSMGEYDDYCVIAPSSGQTVAGICHARGSNADLPPLWLIYINVEDVDAAAEKCKDLGGELIVAPREMGGGRFCVINDPAGAVCGLYRAPDASTSEATG